MGRVLVDRGIDDDDDDDSDDAVVESIKDWIDKEAMMNASQFSLCVWLQLFFILSLLLYMMCVYDVYDVYDVCVPYDVYDVCNQLIAFGTVLCITRN